MDFVVETCSAMNIGDRSEQQDRVSIFAHSTYPGMMMAALADGIGGTTGGAMAAEQVIFKAQQNFEAYAPKSETPAEVLKHIIQEAHSVIRLTRYASEAEPHSTAVVFFLTPQYAQWVHCGDSRLYHFRGESLVSRTEDHSLIAELIRKGKITPQAALIHPQRNVLSSCLGTTDEPEMTISNPVPLRSGDHFLLCSDGVWAYFSIEEMGRILAKLSAREAAAFIVDMARARAAGRGDNISIAIIKLVPKTPSQAITTT